MEVSRTPRCFATEARSLRLARKLAEVEGEIASLIARWEALATIEADA